MKTLLPAAIWFDIQSLAQTITCCQASDALRCQFGLPHWNVLSTFIQPFPLNNGQVLIAQGPYDYTLCFTKSGTLSAHSEDEKARMQMALVGQEPWWAKAHF